MNINKILNREQLATQIKDNLNYFEENKINLLTLRGIYLYGDSGIGKTYFVKQILDEMGYDAIIYDSSDTRNKAFVETITKHKNTNVNVLSMFYKKKKNIAIVFDEIDSMNIGDKGGITTLIKIIRPKKTKKQHLEDISNIPIICIGTNITEKKFIELSKICHTHELPIPTISQMKLLCMNLFKSENISTIEQFALNNIQQVFVLHRLYMKNKQLVHSNLITQYLKSETIYDNTKATTKRLMNHPVIFKNHTHMINETDRTTIALLLHENTIDCIHSHNGLYIYKQILNTFCFADYIDRITFQKQIWQLNEMSAILKIFYNLFLLHQTPYYNSLTTDIRFTKILTKYSTEYSNYIFIQELCQKLDMDKKDMLLFFYYIKHNPIAEYNMALHPEYNISRLDVNRIHKYMITHFSD